MSKYTNVKCAMYTILVLLSKSLKKGKEKKPKKQQQKNWNQRRPHNTGSVFF